MLRDSLRRQETRNMLAHIYNWFTKAQTGQFPSRLGRAVGDDITVLGGAFVDYEGTIKEVRPSDGKVRVAKSIFGRVLNWISPR